MNIEDRRAVTLAYKCVIELGWTHSRLEREYGLTLPTLRNVRDGKRMKKENEKYYTKVFIRIINEAFHENNIHNGGADSAKYYKMMSEILLATYGIYEVK